MKASRLSANVPSPLIQEEQGAAAANHKKILKPLVLKVGKQSARSIVQHADSGFLRYIFKCSVAAVAVEPIWQSRRLADIEIIESIIVEIARGHTVVAVNINAARAIQDSSPVIGPAKHLVSCTIPFRRELERLRR